jgi:transposase-like protein
VRRAVIELAASNGDSLASLSRKIGRNAAYLHQFVERGTPARLPEDARLSLAQHWQIDERRLGARDPWSPRDDR